MKQKVKVSSLYYLAVKYNEKAISDQEIRTSGEITNQLIEEIENKLKKGELINIQVVGRVATSKSTTAIELCRQILSRMNKPMKIDNICPDQLEYARKMMNTKTQNTCLVIDEYNVMGETGLNATIEAKLYNHFSDVHAQRYVHKILASPTRIFDNNTDIFLETIEVNKEEKTTTLRVYYRIQKPVEPIFQFVGIAKLSVEKVLTEDYYKRYRKKKFKRMELLTKEGVRDLRELEDARIVKAVYDDLKDIAETISLSRGYIQSLVQTEAQNQKKVFSLLTEESLIERITGLLKMQRGINEAEYKILRKKGLTPEQKQKVDTVIKKGKESLQKTINRLDKLNNLYEEYMKI